MLPYGVAGAKRVMEVGHVTKRFGLFGTGRWANDVHAAALSAEPSVELVGVWGRNGEKTRSVAERWGIVPYDDVDRLLAEVGALPPEAGTYTTGHRGPHADDEAIRICQIAPADNGQKGPFRDPPATARRLADARHHGQMSGDDHEHDRDHAHDDAHQHGGPDHHGPGLLGRLRALVAPHSHDAGDSIDTELEASAAGIRAVWLSFAVLAITFLLQAAVVLASGSVALLGDALHNLADALTAVPLAIAFTVGRRAATRRYTYGYGRAEDLAGIVVVVLIAASSVLAAVESIRRLLDPRPVHQLGLVAVAAVIGFAGNELVAQYRISVGRRIGSAALVADGLHARTDGLTSLAVLLGVGGLALGWRWADPVIGLVISAAIVTVLWQAARDVFRRLMDAVDPQLVDQVESVLRGTSGVRDVGEVRLRWIGHALRAECEVVVDPALTIVAGHQIAEEAEHRLLHEVRRLTAAMVHADPHAVDGTDHHELSGHHRPP